MTQLELKLSVKEASVNDSVTFARDTALAQLRTAIIILRHTSNTSESTANLKAHIQRLFDGPEELLWTDYVSPSIRFTLPGKVVKGREQLSIVQKCLLMIGMELDLCYLDNPHEKYWILNWTRGKKARLFWTKDSGWDVKLYLAKGEYIRNGFILDDFLEQVGIDRGFWGDEW